MFLVLILESTFFKLTSVLIFLVLISKLVFFNETPLVLMSKSTLPPIPLTDTFLDRLLFIEEVIFFAIFPSILVSIDFKLTAGINDPATPTVPKLSVIFFEDIIFLFEIDVAKDLGEIFALLFIRFKLTPAALTVCLCPVLIILCSGLLFELSPLFEIASVKSSIRREESTPLTPEVIDDSIPSLTVSRTLSLV